MPFALTIAMILAPPEDGTRIELIRGPNIAPLPVSEPLSDALSCEVILKTGDNITTDDIMPAGKYLPLRSNVPEYAKHVFEGIDGHFYNSAVEAKKKRRWNYCGRGKLWTGIVARTCGIVPDVSRSQSGASKVLCSHPSRQFDEFWHFDIDLYGSG